ncbi:hypothetical protein [Neisseria bergeri]|uniref:hypothetical protein n=1 Tax=Neisseria bergeri TaxID=1906581 RepID=UPI00272BD3CA|nr:hypothetical protein [Neisseria bergeri]
MKQKVKIIVSTVMAVLSAGILVVGCSSFKNGGDVNFQIENPQLNSTVSKQ